MKKRQGALHGGGDHLTGGNPMPAAVKQNGAARLCKAVHNSLSAFWNRQTWIPGLRGTPDFIARLLLGARLRRCFVFPTGSGIAADI